MQQTLRSHAVVLTLAALSSVALFSRDGHAAPAARGGDPGPHFAWVSRAAQQQKPAAPAPAKPQEAGAASLLEQARFAEEQERDFDKARRLGELALEAARREQNADVITLADVFVARAKQRAAGIAASAPQDEQDGMFCRMAESLYDITHFGQGTEESAQAYRDLALLGAYAVPWLEKGIQGKQELCAYDIIGQPSVFVQALAMMTAPEGQAALERLLSSPDPLVRRAVARYADPDRQRALLMRALKDPAEAVREQAVESLARSSDPALFDTVIAFARQGTEAALNWLRVIRPAELLRLATSKDLSVDRRRQALDSFRNAQVFVPDATSVDALLAVARDGGDLELRTRAMDALVSGIARNWKPVDPALLARIEDALMAAPDAYPPKFFPSALAAVASSKGLAMLIARSPTDDLQGQFTGQVLRVLSGAGPQDLPLIADALGKCPAASGVGFGNDFAPSRILQCLEQMAKAGASSAQVAAGARSLPTIHRRVYVERVVGSWIDVYVDRAYNGGTVEKLDPGMIELAREIIRDGDSNRRASAIQALGAGGAPDMLAEILGYNRGSELNGAVSRALDRITRGDPKRQELVLRHLLSIRELPADGLSQAYENCAKPLTSRGTLAAVNAVWSIAEAERLATIVVRYVSGSEGSQFLLAHWKELDGASPQVRAKVIERFGRDLHEPALDTIGEALLDPSDQVRNAGGQAFERYKNERQRAREFENWRNAERRSQQTIAELEALLANQNPDVVLGAVKALASLGSRSSLPKIIALHERFTANVPLQSALRDAAALLSK